MRIIGGDLRGKKLFTPKTINIRPTADRVREAIFNIIGPDIRNKSVLDLFAGTGAMGIEALSRGASQAVFVDSNRQAAAIIEKNIVACGLSGRSRVLTFRIPDGLGHDRFTLETFDIVFMDPPYHQNGVIPSMAALHLNRTLRRQILVIAEHHRSEALSESVEAFFRTDLRHYGKTLVSFYQYDTVNGPSTCSN